MYSRRFVKYVAIIEVNFIPMTKNIYLLIPFSMMLFAGCYQKEDNNQIIFPPALVDFSLYSGSPVFTGTGIDTWDKNIRERGYILLENGIYKMWYTGYNYDIEKTMHLGYATSEDGISWTRYPDNPIYNDYWTEDVHVVKHGDKYYMVAEGENDVAHMLTSEDGIRWIRDGDLDIRKVDGEPISEGPYGTPTLWLEDDKWHLFYERYDSAIWLAKSSDTNVWINVQDDPVIVKGPEEYDLQGVALNQIIKFKGMYYAYYHGTPDEDWARWNSNVAVSEDLVHWTKYEHNPIVDVDDSHGNYSSPILVPEGEGYRLYTMHWEVRLYFQDREK